MTLLRSESRADSSPLINNRMWVESLRATTDPQTGKSIVTNPEIIENAAPDCRLIFGHPGITSPRLLRQTHCRPQVLCRSVSALTEPSKFSESLGWNMASKAATTGKSIALMIDTFHLGRLAFWESIIKPLSFTDPEAAAAVLQTRCADPGLLGCRDNRMARNGEIDPAQLPAILQAQRDVNGLVKRGYNVSKIVDMLHQEWMRQRARRRKSKPLRL